MPDIYTHPNGYTVQRDDRGVRIAITSDAGYTSTWIDNPRVDALRDYLLDELGLWRDEQTGALVVTHSWDGTSATVIYKGESLSGMYPYWDAGLEDDAVARWRATLTPPPREPQSGEVWRIMFPEGQERNALVSCVDGMTAFRWGGDWHPVDEWPADRRRLLVEADGTVVAGDE